MEERSDSVSVIPVLRNVNISLFYKISVFINSRLGVRRIGVIILSQEELVHEDQRGLWADPTTSIATVFSAVCSNAVRDSGPAGD